LLLHDLVDLAVLDRLEVGVGELARLVLGPRVLDGSGAQDAADMVGAERRLGAGGHRASPRNAGFWGSLARIWRTQEHRACDDRRVGKGAERAVPTRRWARFALPTLRFSAALSRAAGRHR